MDGSGATVRAIAAAATSAVPAPDVTAADDHGDGASTWIPPQRKRKRDYHVDAKESSHRQWKAFGSDPTRRSMMGMRTVRILHARALLTRMQLEIYRGDRPAALRLLATLLREFIHLRAALAQAGFELLSSSANEHEQVLRFGRRMAMLDKPNRSTWQLLAASSTLRHDNGLTQHAAHRLAAAVAFLQAVLGQRPERTACMHDAELHGHLGLLMHAQLALAASSRRGTSLRGVKDVGVKPLRAAAAATAEVDARLRTPGARGRAWACQWAGIDARAGMPCHSRSTRARGRSRLVRPAPNSTANSTAGPHLTSRHTRCSMTRARMRAPQMTPWR